MNARRSRNRFDKKDLDGFSNRSWLPVSWLIVLELARGLGRGSTHATAADHP